MRPRCLKGGRRVNIYLDKSAVDTAMIIGKGNISAGIREALVIASIGMISTFKCIKIDLVMSGSTGSAAKVIPDNENVPRNLKGTDDASSLIDT